VLANSSPRGEQFQVCERSKSGPQWRILWRQIYRMKKPHVTAAIQAGVPGGRPRRYIYTFLVGWEWL
jgi:hypothetical protein